MVTKIYSVAGMTKDRNQLITRRPFRAPHHNASMNSLVGGGNPAVPGEVSLAHNGVLFLDEIRLMTPYTHQKQAPFQPHRQYYMFAVF